MQIDYKIATGGIIGIIALIATGLYFFTPEEAEKAYVCTTNNLTVVADSLSSTNKTAYWLENGSTISQVCRNGVWIKLRAFTELHGLDYDNLLKTGVSVADDIPDEELNVAEETIPISQEIEASEYIEFTKDGEIYKLYKFKSENRTEPVSDYCKDKQADNPCNPCYLQTVCDENKECICVR